MQRSVLYTKWIELSHTIRSTEYIIDSFDKNGGLADNELMTMSGGLKRLQEIRETTHTHWDFDANATSFDERVLTVTDPWAPYSGYERVLNSIVEYVCPNEGESGLELAIGTGNLSNKFAAKGAEMSGVDQSFEMLRQCRIKYPRIRTKLGNMMAAPFFDGQFNFVVTSYAFHLLTNEQQLLSLREMDRLTVNGGRVCIADHMFLQDRDRLATMERLKRDGNDKAIESIEQHNFANLSNLISWFVQHSYTPKTIPINESVHLLLAYKENSY
ncbi:class I SAM-dependent methyltransferase [Alicyclobacillus suci]|uniref:class I SAM-dependent methyltransferase n=1 Tax=Alicyclobacillus suci TaxID=2816080 RepID=UPI0034DD4E16